MTFEEWWESDLVRHGFGNRLLLEEAWQAATKAERERCVGIALEFCHCPEHYTARGLIDPTCDCHDIADEICAVAIREQEEGFK